MIPMRRFMPLRSVAAFFAVILPAAACTDRNPAAFQVREPTPAPAGATLLRCSVVVLARTLSCESEGAGVPSALRAVILGGQGTYVHLSSSGTVYDGSSILRSNVSVENLTSQSLGTEDGHTPSPEGVRVFFASGPTVTAGSGTVTVANPDGTGVFTSAEQPYFQYQGILFPGDTTAAREWRFSVPPTVQVFAFTVLVTARVPKEPGWVRVLPMAPSLPVGDTVRMSADVRTVTGRVVSEPVAWTSSDTAVATVDSAGLVTGVGAGTAVITAASGARSGSASVEVAAPSAAPPPSILWVEMHPTTVTANGSDTVWVRAGAASPLGVVSVTFVVNGPGSNQLQCFGGRLTGTPLNGEYGCGVVVPSGAKGGVWALTGVVASTENTYRFMYNRDVVAAGGTAFLNVRRPGEDVTAPVVTAFTFSPDTARAGVDSVTVVVSFTDAGVGASQATVLFVGPNPGDGRGCGTGAITGTPQAGTIRCTFPLPADVSTGTWRVGYVEVPDMNGNVHLLYAEDLRQAGFPSELTIVVPSPS